MHDAACQHPCGIRAVPVASLKIPIVVYCDAELTILQSPVFTTLFEAT